MSDLSQALDQMRSFIQQGEFAKAEKIGLSVYKHHKNDVALNKGLALAINFQDRAQEACMYFTKACQLDENDVDAHYNLATLCLMLGHYKKAEKTFVTLLAKGQKQAQIYQNYINVLLKQKKKEQALTIFAEAFDLYPDHYEIGSLYVAAYEEVNQLEDAWAILEKLPPSGLRHLMEARLYRREKKIDQALDAILQCDENKLDSSVLAEFYLERGLIQDKAEKYEDAFASFNTSNQQMAKQSTHTRLNPQGFIEDLDRLKAIYQRSPVRKDIPTEGKRVAFFVGFPRSGTTLMEQMLKSHSKIVTTDEKSPFEYLIQQERKGRTLQQIWDEWREKDLRWQRIRFWQIVDEFGFHVDKDGLLVDKLPLNIVWAPFIRLLFPGCPLIVAYRDPRDVCLSAFIQKFSLNNAMANFLDWNQTGQTYDQVMSVWEVAKDTLGGKYLEYRYEDLIDEFEQTIKQVIDYLGLSFEEGIYEYRKLTQQRDVNTPSYREVINPLNKDAIKRYKNYPDQIDQISPYIQKWVAKFGYNKQA
ncbi:MAG: sulfotransferase [Methylocystaceae bacterium]|nr:sulfotransferase [Methylocystaceae bacterium]